jgi:ribosomal protein S18 acetylase RimI-like enzyme
MTTCAKDPIHLTASHLDQAVESLTRAFADDPMYAVIFPDVEARIAKTRLLWHALLRYQLRYGEVYTTPTVSGVAAWAKPERRDYPLWRTIRTGFALPLAVARFAREERARMMTIMRHADKIHKRIMPDPHWYLVVLGVDPACQGQGIGSGLLQPVLERAAADGVPCYLEAVTAPNVAFYQRHGFQIVEEASTLNVSLRCMVRTS